MAESPRYRRESRGLEFERVAFFSDAVFAIAITLLVVEVGIPEAIPDTEDPGELLDALGDKVPVIASFLVGCFVIGGYWVANHRFVSMLAEIDRRYVGYTVVYLAFVALLPFPTSVLGEYPQNPISVAVFALNMAIISSIEAALLHYAWRKGLLSEDLPADVERWALKLSLFPVVMFALSVPVAFVNTWLGVSLWFGSVPFQAWFLRRRPVDADRYSF